MDVVQFFNLWESVTIALSEAEKGRLITALVAESHDEDVRSIMTGREKNAFPYLQTIIEKATNERNV